MATTALALAPGVGQAQDALPAPVRAALKSAGIPDTALGVAVIEPGGRPVLLHNAQQPMNPASVMKVVTTYAALDILGPAYTWRTDAYADGPVQAGRLNGNLVLKGGGDPRLTMENLWMLLRDLRARGLRDISGDLVIDRSYFQIDDLDPGQFDGEPTRPYNAGADALLLNFRAVRLTFVPDPQGRTVRILSEPPLPEFGIVSRLDINDGPCDSWPEKPVADLVRYTLTFEGSYPLSCGEKTRHFMLLPPLDYARGLFDHLWRGLGGSFSGRARYDVLPSGAQWLGAIDSAPPAEIVRDINKNSNNVMARQVFLTLGSSVSVPAMADKAREAVFRWLDVKGIPAPELSLENGSGLSRTERIAPVTLARLLENAWLSPLSAEFVSSLPLAGVDGTLKRRLSGTSAAGRAHLKTGYLDTVRGIAGYVHGADGRVLVVVSLINHPRARDAVGVQEAVVGWALDAVNQRRCCIGMQRATPKSQSESRTPP